MISAPKPPYYLPHARHGAVLLAAVVVSLAISAAVGQLRLGCFLAGAALFTGLIVMLDGWSAARRLGRLARPDERLAQWEYEADVWALQVAMITGGASRRALVSCICLMLALAVAGGVFAADPRDPAVVFGLAVGLAAIVAAALTYVMRLQRSRLLRVRGECHIGKRCFYLPGRAGSWDRPRVALHEEPLRLGFAWTPSADPGVGANLTVLVPPSARSAAEGVVAHFAPRRR